MSDGVREAAASWLAERFGVPIQWADVDDLLAAIADHDGLVDVLRGHSRLGNWECGCGGCHLYAGEPERRRDAFAAHLADVVRAWLRGE